MKKITINHLTKIIELYMFYPKLRKLEKKGNFDSFFENLNNLDEHLNDCEIFLNLQSAIQFSRFIQTDHAILKLHVPQVAINGHGHGFTLKKGFITQAQIEGCFPGWAKGMLYLENPGFNLDYLIDRLDSSANQAVYQQEVN